MILIALFVLILFALAAAFVWLADHPGTVTIVWLGSEVTISVLQAIVAIAFLAVFVTIFWLVVSAILNSPKTFGRWRQGRRRDKGFDALSRGLIAAGAGNAPMARKLAKESQKHLDNEPLVALLDAQTALLEGKRGDARKKFESMLERDETKLLGLRGLYVEAEQEGVSEAAAYFANEANAQAPGTPWAAKALLKTHTASGQWEDALKALGMNNASGLLKKGEYERKRAVLLTALAQGEENEDLEKAKGHALAAHKLAPDLVPAALVAARIAKRDGDVRKAAKVLEASWKRAPHPQVSMAYVNLWDGETARDKRKRAETLARKQADHVESQYLLASTYLDSGDFVDARKAMEKLLTAQPSERACLLMADIEEAEHGDRGRVREWLSRAVTAPRDATWIADGVTSEKWAPISPVDGRLDAFEWKVPSQQQAAIDGSAGLAQLVHAPLPPKPEPTPVAAAVETVDIVKEDEAVATIEVEDAPSDKKVVVEEAEVIKAADSSVSESVSDPKPADPVQEGPVERTIEAVKVGGSTGAVAAGVAGVAVAAVTEPDKAESVSKEPETDMPLQSSDLGSGETIVKADTEVKADDKKPTEKDDLKPADGASQKASPYTAASPFRKKANLDEDEDGVIDHRPDDPGINSDEKPTKKKGLFF